ncbi:MAG: WD40/YVTN/BNR-like repeat-containing protein, partial [Terriglobales bacterium]
MVAEWSRAARRGGMPIAAVFLLTGLAAAQRPAPRRKFRDNPEGRQAWFARGRQAPPGQPAAWYLQRARRQLERIPVLRPRGSPPAATLAHGAVRLLGAPQPEFGGQWTALGPAPETTSYWGDVAGRVTALALDPADSTGNTLYMAAAYGGLWKSTNAMGASPSFIPIGDNLPTLAVGSIAIDDALSSPAIFVGSGEPNNSGDSYYGAGIFASTDGGQTWTQSTQADGG